MRPAAVHTWQAHSATPPFKQYTRALTARARKGCLKKWPSHQLPTWQAQSVTPGTHIVYFRPAAMRKKGGQNSIPTWQAQRATPAFRLSASATGPFSPPNTSCRAQRAQQAQRRKRVLIMCCCQLACQWPAHNHQSLLKTHANHTMRMRAFSVASPPLRSSIVQRGMPRSVGSIW